MLSSKRHKFKLTALSKIKCNLLMIAYHDNYWKLHSELSRPTEDSIPCHLLKIVCSFIH